MVVHLARASVIAQRFRLSVFYAHKILAVAISYNSYCSSEICIIVLAAGCAAASLCLCHGSSVDAKTMMQYATNNLPHSAAVVHAQGLGKRKAQ